MIEAHASSKARSTRSSRIVQDEMQESGLQGARRPQQIAQDFLLGALPIGVGRVQRVQ